MVMQLAILVTLALWLLVLMLNKMLPELFPLIEVVWVSTELLANF